MQRAAPRVIEIDDTDRLADLRPVWGALLSQTPRASFFQSLDWLTVFWRHCGAHRRLRVLLVEGVDGEALGIVPLAVARERTRLGRLRVLGYPLDEWGTMYGPLGRNPMATLALALRHVHDAPRDWDLLELRWAPTTGGDDRRTAAALFAAGLPGQRTPWGQVGMIDLADGWGLYWAGRTAHWRKNVRRAERRLADLGAVEYVRYRPCGTGAGDLADADSDLRGDLGCDPRWDLWDACVAVSSRGWQATAEGTTLCDPAVAEFLRDAHRAACRAGTADLNLLYVGGRPAAFAYGYTLGGHFVGLRMGYDAAVAEAGAGSLLMARLIEDSCARGDRSINLGAGYLDAKRPWLTSVERTWRHAHYPPGVWRAQAIRLRRALVPPAATAGE